MKNKNAVITFGIKERFDCKNWVEYAIKEFGEDTKIIITGISMGAATVLMAASMDLPHNVIGVLADCGYDSPKNIIQKVIKEMKLPPKLTYPFVKLSAKLLGKFNIEEYSPVESVKNTNIPIIFIHGDKDSFVPHEMSIKMYNECVSEKKLVLIKDADHGVAYLKDPNTYLKELYSFFKNE